MLIYFGTKSKHLKSEPVESACTGCGYQKQYASVFQKYFHIFLIPVLPYSKVAFLQCPNCKRVLTEKEAGLSVGATLVSAKAQSKTPLYLFTGLFLIAVVVGLGSYQKYKVSDKSQQSEANPH